MVRRDVAERKIARAASWLDDAQEILSRTAEGSSSDPRSQDLAGFYLLLAIQESVDLAAHGVADAGWSPPEDAGGVFDVLADHGVDRPDARRLHACCRRPPEPHRPWLHVHRPCSPTSGSNLRLASTQKVSSRRRRIRWPLTYWQSSQPSLGARLAEKSEDEGHDLRLLQILLRRGVGHPVLLYFQRQGRPDRRAGSCWCCHQVKCVIARPGIGLGRLA